MKENGGIVGNYERLKLSNYKYIRKRRTTSQWHRLGFQQDHRRTFSQIK